MRTVAALALALIACGPDGRDEGGVGGGSGSGSGSNMEGCSDEAKFVYTVDTLNTFSRFDPMTKTFMSLGKLACPAPMDEAPFSMSVDRDTVAWVLYTDGTIYRVDILGGLACTATSWTSSSSNTLFEFGMGFSSNAAGSTEDTLFISGGSDPLFDPTSQLATLNTGTMQSQNVGTVTGWPELTGTGNAELWGWFPSETAPRVEQINKSNGSPIKTYNIADSRLQGTPLAWAFAFWGGDFFVFLQTDVDELNSKKTTVYQIDGTNGSVKGATPANSKIVGAGVSTCAPTIIL